LLPLEKPPIGDLADLADPDLDAALAE
jgi:hypothetical protein